MYHYLRLPTIAYYLLLLPVLPPTTSTTNTAARSYSLNELVQVGQLSATSRLGSKQLKQKSGVFCSLCCDFLFLERSRQSQATFATPRFDFNVLVSQLLGQLLANYFCHHL
jgi:hypothetical protein